MTRMLDDLAIEDVIALLEEPRTRQSLADELGSPAVDPARDVRAWRDEAGALDGFAWIRWVRSDGERDARLTFGAAPAREADVVRWAIARVAEEPAPRRLTCDVLDPARAARLAGSGFAPVRERLHMARAARPVPDAAMPPGYRLRRCLGMAEAAPYCAAVDEVFRDAHDQTPLTIEQFAHDLASPDYRPEHDLVLEARDGSIAGFLFLVVEEERPREGRIASIGVRAAHRRRGLATAMLADAIARLGAAGCDTITLEVDADSVTGAWRVYERSGFVTRARQQRLALVI